MSQYCLCTPYTLNLKLKSLYPVTRKIDLNKLYHNLNDSIPILTNQFCCLKNKTKALNKSLTKIPIVYKNFASNRSCSNFLSKSLKTTPNTPCSFYNYYYISPKPVIKPYLCKNSKYHNNIINSKYDNNYNSYNSYNNIYRYRNRNPKNNSQIKLHFNYDSCLENPIKNYIKKDNRNYSAINMIRNNNNEYNNNYINNRRKIKNEYEQKFNKLNDEINEKDKIINEMQGALDDAVDQLRKKDHENSMLQSEILELRTKSNFNYDMAKNNNIQNKINNNSYIYEKDPKKRYKRKNLHLNNEQNIQFSNKYNNNKSYKNYYNNDNNNSNDDNMDHKWEEIRKLNKKMDNLLYKNENKLKKYEKIKNDYNKY